VARPRPGGVAHRAIVAGNFRHVDEVLAGRVLHVDHVMEVYLGEPHDGERTAVGRMPAVPARHHLEGDDGLAEQAGEPPGPPGEDVAAGR
jgi:hypothetical protein